MQDVIIVNQKEFDIKLKKIKNDTASQLHILADFDNTLTKAYINGEKFDSAIAQIRKNNYLSKDYVQKAFALYDKYHPIEIDPNISNDDKNKYMIEWWTEHLKLKIASGMNKSVLEDIITKDKIQLRENAIEFFKLAKKKEIPILILSAGLGDLITGVLEKHKCNFDNIHVISNFYDYNTDGTIKGYKGKIIHSFNKDETEIKLLPHYKKIETRKNIILLGDNLGDLEMSKGIDYKTILNIAFFNYKDKPELIDDYKKQYNVIITNDGSMDFIVKLIKELK